MLKSLCKANTSQNNELVSLINSGLKDLKEGIKKMSKEERKIEKPDKIVKTVKKILKLNKENQQGKGIKILNQTKYLVDYQLLQLNYKQETILTNLKMNEDNYCILFIVQKI